MIVAALLVFTIAVPTGDPSSRKVTTPEVAGFPLEDMVTVKATLLPKTALLEEVAREVVVVAGATVTMTGLEIEAAKFEVPP